MKPFNAICQDRAWATTPFTAATRHLFALYWGRRRNLDSRPGPDFSFATRPTSPLPRAAVGSSRKAQRGRDFAADPLGGGGGGGGGGLGGGGVACG